MGFFDDYRVTKAKKVKKEILEMGDPHDDMDAEILQAKLALLKACLTYPPFDGAENDETYQQGVNALEKYSNEQYEKERPAREQYEKEEEMITQYTFNPKLLNDLTLDELIDLKLMIKSGIDKAEDENQELSLFTQKSKDVLKQLPQSAELIDLVSHIFFTAPTASNLNKRKRFVELLEEKIKRATLPTAPEDKLTKSRNRIRSLKVDKAKDIEGMREEGEDEESIRRRENMWDDAISREEEELRKLL